MLINVFVATSFAALLTAMLAFRFELRKRPGLLVSYFTFFALLELALETYVLPPGVFGPEVGVVLTVLTILFILASFGVRQMLGTRD